MSILIGENYDLNSTLTINPEIPHTLSGISIEMSEYIENLLFRDIYSVMTQKIPNEGIVSTTLEITQITNKLDQKTQVPLNSSHYRYHMISGINPDDSLSKILKAFGYKFDEITNFIRDESEIVFQTKVNNSLICISWVFEENGFVLGTNFTEINI